VSTRAHADRRACAQTRARPPAHTDAGNDDNGARNDKNGASLSPVPVPPENITRRGTGSNGARNATTTLAHRWNKDYLMAARAEIEVSDSEKEAVEGVWD